MQFHTYIIFRHEFSWNIYRNNYVIIFFSLHPHKHRVHAIKNSSHDTVHRNFSADENTFHCTYFEKPYSLRECNRDNLEMACCYFT